MKVSNDIYRLMKSQSLQFKACGCNGHHLLVTMIGLGLQRIKCYVVMPVLFGQLCVTVVSGRSKVERNGASLRHLKFFQSGAAPRVFFQRRVLVRKIKKYRAL